MQTSHINRLINGFRKFREHYYQEQPQLFKLLKQGQRPAVMVIACSDSRVDPAILLRSQPGELFIVRNVANIVPPYEPDTHYHGTSAALEFAVRDLKVSSVVILGHSHCGGIQALVQNNCGDIPSRDFIGPWMSIVRPACDRHVHHPKADTTQKLDNIEQAAIRQSLENLRSYPWVSERIDQNELTIHGWWFELKTGELWLVDPDNGSIHPIDEN